MSAQLDHTILWCRDKQKASAFLTQMLGLPPPVPFGAMLVVKLANGVSVDFYDQDGKRRRETYDSQKAAKAEMGKRLERIRKRTYRAQADIPLLKAVAESWLASKADLRPAARYVLETTSRIFSGRSATFASTKLTVEDVESLREESRKRLAPRTVVH